MFGLFHHKLTQSKHRWTQTSQDWFEFINQNCQQKQVCEQQHCLIRLDSLISITFTHLLPQESRFTHSQQWTQPIALINSSVILSLARNQTRVSSHADERVWNKKHLHSFQPNPHFLRLVALGVLQGVLQPVRVVGQRIHGLSECVWSVLRCRGIRRYAIQHV